MAPIGTAFIADTDWSQTNHGPWHVARFDSFRLLSLERFRMRLTAAKELAGPLCIHGAQPSQVSTRVQT